MTGPVQFVEAAHLDAERSDDVWAALKLDWFCVEKAAAVLGVGLLPVVASISLIGENAPSAAIFAVTWGMIVALRPWAIDAEEHGAELRRVLPLQRRAVVAARYVFSTLLVLLGTLLMVAGVLVTGLLTSRDITEALVTLTVVAGVWLLQVLVFVPVMVRHGKWIAIVALGLTVALAGAFILAVPSLVLGFDPDVEARLFAISAVAAAWVLPLVAAPLSYRSAQRAYAARDF